MAEPVIEVLAGCYARSKAGRIGHGSRDWTIDFKELLTVANCAAGESRVAALEALNLAEARGVLALDRHTRDRGLIFRVRVPLECEARLFALANTPSPSAQREALATAFESAVAEPAGERWQTAWAETCTRLAAAARNGGTIAPFSRDDPSANAELLTLMPRLLTWRGESLLRFASCVLCRDSKRLGDLRPKLRRILAEVSAGELNDLTDLGILDTPRSCLLHGPLRLRLRGHWLDLGMLTGPVRLSALDLTAAEALDTTASRCVTIENETTFHELAKLRCGDLLICSSYAGSATLHLLSSLPDTLEFWHFGDSDPQGFDILRDLRERSGRPFQSLHMRFYPAADATPLTAEERRLTERLISASALAAERGELEKLLAAGNKGRFEQESLGQPKLDHWPFYPTN